ncbi:MAG: D-alanine--D-alanine ligase [Phycisphaerales bacterium]|nr:D-alanine--D-alanine ligase [Phycisphaerales bacterium]
MKGQVLILAGGLDAEREVSLAGGREVAEALDASPQYIVKYREIDQPTQDELAELPGDVIFPVLHGPWGEGGTLQELLENDGRPYVGSRPKAARLAMDKVRSKELARELGIATPDWIVVHRDEPTPALDLPVIVKPIDDGSSVDLHHCRTKDEVEQARQQAHMRHERLMIEQFAEGCELTVGMVGTLALPVLEVKPADGLYTYAAKYERDDTRYDISPRLDAETAQCLTSLSERIFRKIGCRHIARVDWIYDEYDGPTFLEINTMPGFTRHSLVPMACQGIGLDMIALCESLLSMAITDGSTHEDDEMAVAIGRGCGDACVTSAPAR